MLALGVGDRISLGAVGEDPVRDLVVARELDPVDRVLRAVVAVADLEGRGPRVVAGEGEGDQVHLHPRDRLDQRVLAVVALLGLHRHQLLLGGELAEELDLEIADRVKVDLEAVAIAGREIGAAHQRLHLLADEIVDAHPPRLDLRRDLLGQLVDPDHLGVDAPGVAIRGPEVLRSAVGEHLVDVAAHPPGVERERVGVVLRVERLGDPVVDRLAHRQRLVALGIVGDLGRRQALVAAAGVAAAVAREGEAGAADHQQLVGELGELGDRTILVDVGEAVLGERAELARPEALRLILVGLGDAVGLADVDGEAGLLTGGVRPLVLGQETLEEGQADDGAAEPRQEGATPEAGAEDSTSGWRTLRHGPLVWLEGHGHGSLLSPQGAHGSGRRRSW